ncbi:MAG: tetratricopeptide repeat protein [Candidatus Eiseniibacteriota bacterium]
MDSATDIKQRAQRLIQRGAFKEALTEYARLTAGDGVDPSVFILVGDLHLRMGQRDQAGERYLEAANGYERLGLLRNAIAVFKKLLRSQPRHPEVHKRIADLYARNGHLAESVSHYLDHAALCLENDNEEAARAVLEQISQLGTPSVRVASRMVDLYLAMGDRFGAVYELVRQANEFEKRGRTDQATHLREQVHTIDADGFISEEVARAVAEEAGDGDAAADSHAAGPGEGPAGAADVHSGPSPADSEVLGLERAGDLYGAEPAPDAGDDDTDGDDGELSFRSMTESLGHSLAGEPEVEPDAEPVDGEPEAEPNAEPVDAEPGAEPVGGEPEAEPDAEPVDAESDAEPVDDAAIAASGTNGSGEMAGEVRLRAPDESLAESEVDRAICNEERGWRDQLREFLDTGDRAGADLLLGRLARQAELAGQATEAQALYAQLWELGRREPSVAGALADLAAQLGDAVDQARWLTELGELELHAGDWAAARQRYAAALEVEPASDLARRRLERLEAADRPNGSHRDVEPHTPEVSSETDQIDRILARFRQDIGSQLDESDHAAHYDLALAYVEMGLEREALAELKIAQADPDHRQRSLELQAACYSRIGDPRTAAEYLRVALEELDALDAREADLRVRLGTVLMEAGETEEARAVLRQVVDRHPSREDARLHLEALGG